MSSPPEISMPSLPSPRLPNELFELIVDYIEDSDTMRQCCLAGSCLLPYAQRALFEEVRLLIGPSRSNNVAKMLECYTTRPYAQYARHLVIKYCGSRYRGKHALSDYPELQKLVALLSTCQQSIESAMTPSPTPASRISSLYISDFSGSTEDFARIIRPFPRLTTLKCQIKELSSGSSDSLNRFLASAPAPPPIQELRFNLSHFRGLASDVLFPPGTDVCLHSLTINHYVDMDLWNSILRRAADVLENISIRGHNTELEYHIVDLSANKRLRSVFVEATDFVDEALVEWAIPTLHTINSDRLESVVLGECVVRDPDAARQALATLDEALTEGPSKLSLRRVDIIDWILVLPDGELERSSDAAIAFVRTALPKCCGRKLVYHASCEDPL